MTNYHRLGAKMPTLTPSNPDRRLLHQLSKMIEEAGTSFRDANVVASSGASSAAYSSGADILQRVA